MIPYIVVLSGGSFTVQYHHAQSPLILSLQELYLLVPPRSGSEGLILSQGIRKYVASCEAQHTEDPRFPPSLQADVPSWQDVEEFSSATSEGFEGLDTAHSSVKISISGCLAASCASCTFGRYVRGDCDRVTVWYCSRFLR